MIWEIMPHTKISNQSENAMITNIRNMEKGLILETRTVVKKPIRLNYTTTVYFVQLSNFICMLAFPEFIDTYINLPLLTRKSKKGRTIRESCIIKRTRVIGMRGEN